MNSQLYFYYRPQISNMGRVYFIRVIFEIFTRMQPKQLFPWRSRSSRLTMPLACLNSMPLEIIIEIFEWIPRRDLKNMRLVSRKFQDYAKPLLFKTIYLKFNGKSYERLQAVAKDKTLRTLVRCVCYDGSDYVDYRAYFKGLRRTEEGFENWIRCNAGHGLYLSEGGRQKFLAGFSQEQLKTFYEAYCRHITGQRPLCVRKIERGIRCYAISRFSNLMSISFYAPRYAPDEARYENRLINEPPSFESLSPLAQEILQQPEALGSITNLMYNFWRFVEETCCSPFAPTLRAIRGFDLRGGHWADHPTLASCYKGTSLLTHLQLSIGGPTHSICKPTIRRIAEFLEHVPALQILQLSCGTSYNSLQTGITGNAFQNRIKLSDIINENTYWEKLKHLSLRMMDADETELRLFLAKHSKTLRTLELVNTNLLNDRRNTGWSIRASASWIDFCYFLNERMDLEKVTFGGQLSAHDFEDLPQKIQTQAPEVYKDFRPYPESYTPSADLRRQIEGFVARKCPFPSVPCPENPHENNARDQDEPPLDTLPWSWTPNSEGVWWLSESY
jgi:hypothetical protein